MYQILVNTAGILPDVDPVVAMSENEAIEALLAEMRITHTRIDGPVPDLYTIAHEARRALRSDSFFSRDIGGFEHAVERFV